MQADGSFEFIGGPADTFYLDGYPICMRQVESSGDIGHLLTTCVLLGVLAGLIVSKGYFGKLLEGALHPQQQKEDEDTPLDHLAHRQELSGFQGY